MRDWLALARSLDDDLPLPAAVGSGASKNRDPSCSETSESSETASFEAFDHFGTLPLSVPEAGGPYAAGLAGEWQRAFTRLSPDRDPCPGFRRWHRVYGAAADFLRRHAGLAADLGWSTEELWGVHREVGAIRVDCAGALLLTGGRLVEAVTADAVIFGLLTYRRSATPPAGSVVPVWSFRS